MKYIVKDATVIPHWARTSKGTELANFVRGLQWVVLDDSDAILRIEQRLTEVVRRLNIRYAKPSDWRVIRTNFACITIRPLAPRSCRGENTVARISFEGIDLPWKSEKVDRYFDYITKEGGAK